ncbi:sensor histidine kinase [Caldimonas brevitalea]|uniref:histidine kinase n=2 Tax=Caldimonas brevitalea TaxID=413882 RepID=A0A0G3BRZ2_9BURK|nr:sensor histidine kinase [Caldimonas brevitalea]
MSLSDLIQSHVDAIVDEWAEFAKTNLPTARELAPEELRDHAKLLLQHVASDIRAPQSDSEQHEKSRGNRPSNAPELTATARADAEQRFRQGFTLKEVVAEYRALRASVVRRWFDQLETADLDTLAELIRFNEAIDQAISESLAWYVDRVEESRDLMLGVLGHDLRNPLGAAGNSVHYLLVTDGLTGTQTKAVVRIQSSVDRMRKMVDDLLDFTRTRLGLSLALAPRRANLGQVCRETVDELRAFHPDRTLQMDCSGDLSGEWDVSRIGQLVSNLVANAMQHGRPDTPVSVSLRGEGGEISLKVHNEGPPIAPQAQRTLFDPLMRPLVQEAERREGSSGLGLGLYIVREISLAHGGEIQVASSERDGTTFTVRLPRQPPSTPA